MTPCGRLQTASPLGLRTNWRQKPNSALGNGSYEQNLAQQRARDQSISPWVSVPGQIAGGVAGGVLAAPIAAEASVATGLSKLPWLLRAAGSGAGVGALYGAGNADSNRLQGAEQGAEWGAALGPVGVGVGRAVTAAGRGLLGLANPASRAGYDIARALSRDGDTPEALAARAAAANATRPETTLADVGGENTRGLVERIANTPGAARTKAVGLLVGRRQDQADRIANDLSTLTGSTQTARQAIDANMAARAEMQLCSIRLLIMPVTKLIWSPESERLTGAPGVQQAMRSAVSGWQRSQIAAGYGSATPGAVVNKIGDMAGVETSAPALQITGGRVPAYANCNSGIIPRTRLTT